MLIKNKAYPRAGLIGNPSDGYYGKTIAFTFKEFSAQIELWESPELELLPSRRDHSVFRSMCDLHQDVKRHGYYGGFRLLKASCKAFLEYCNERGISLENKNFTMRYRSDIPGRVGLAGSSAIITACMRGLTEFYGVDIPKYHLANLVLSVENNELLIPAGLQDRVAQAYEGLTYMDFDQHLMQERGYGEYEVLNPAQFPPCYIAYREDLAEGTEVYHNDLRSRYRRKDPDVHAAVRRWAELADELKKQLQARSEPESGSGAQVQPFANAEMHACLNENFDLRARLYDVGEGNRFMVETARLCGASAKFAGSGGAIIGFLASRECRNELQNAFAKEHIHVIFPTLF